MEKSLEAKAQEVEELHSLGNATGNNQYSKKEETLQRKHSSLTPKPQYGNSQDYLLSRIKRDFPEVIPRIREMKEFTSARAAAIHCGILKKRQHIYVSTPGKMAAKLKEALEPENLASSLQGFTLK
ncbi:hypothetical protein AVDCRST_MAG92-3020 [uncultured Coleofasciculus sp.]|uniref:Uncharacterized protein n=1 Tax=uncultured Coleofasciculus sp. TaxID=1267456 RepID=A0A6J4JBS2_9CYAN|nr:hypothetical protein AVDCRST_MAG92-3020 [uncultured Coleofasciculus sp.]